ncbi:MAG TPA: hypothetical protein VMS65_13945, partial [Polyangiaceae bacterium]|nr:hypothetical protein [Polyangiaceae bacterium]
FMKTVGAAYALAKGTRAPDAKLSDTAKKLGWRLARVDLKAAELERLLVEFDALVRDRELWKLLAKRVELDPKVSPKSQVLPLRGKGLPAGARALVLTIPAGMTEEIRKKRGSKSKVETKEPIKLVLGMCSDGPDGALLVVTSDEKDATERLRDYLTEGKKRLGERSELSELNSKRALYAEFFTLLGLLDSVSDTSKATSLLPNHGETPIIWSTTATPGPPLVLSGTLTIPSGAMADLPGITADFLGSL